MLKIILGQDSLSVLVPGHSLFRKAGESQVVVVAKAEGGADLTIL